MFFKQSKQSKTPKGANTPRRRTAQPETDTSNSAQFKRNRTISAYHGPLSTPEASARSQAHHLSMERRKAGGLFAIAATVVIVLGLLLWQIIAQVQVVSSTKPLVTAFDGAKYEQIISRYFELNPTQRLRVALDTTALSKFVTDTLPEVQKVDLNGFSGIAHGSFTITFRVPVAGWQMAGQQYYVDAEGVVFETNYYGVPSVQIVDESGVSAEQGTAVAGGRLLAFIGKVVALAGERGYSVTKVILPQNTTRTVYASFSQTPVVARFTIDRGAGEQIEDFDRSVKFLTTRNEIPQYIDVRVAKRAAYK